MAYRDMRKFCEMLRTLGYPSIVSMESFRTCNFPVMADLLVWLARKFSFDLDIPETLETEEDKVTLIATVANFMMERENIKLDTKRLYIAQGYAVKELLKIASPLYTAWCRVINNKDEKGPKTIETIDLSDFEDDVRRARQLVTDMTACSADLYDLLGKEVDMRPARAASLNRLYEPSEVEKKLKNADEAISKEILDTEWQIKTYTDAELDLDGKIQRRKEVAKRFENRLKNLNRVRPVFMKEYNDMEKELEKLFVDYSSHVRALAYLEQIKKEEEKAEKLREEEAASETLVEKISLEAFDSPVNFIHRNDETEEDTGTDDERQRSSKTRLFQTSTALRDKNSNSDLLSSISSGTDSDELLERSSLFMDRDVFNENIRSDDDMSEFDLTGNDRKQHPPPSGVPILQNSSDDDF